MVDKITSRFGLLSDPERRTVEYLLRLAGYSTASLRTKLAQASQDLSIEPIKLIETLLSLEKRGLMRLTRFDIQQAQVYGIYDELMALDTSFVRDAVPKDQYDRSRDRLIFLLRRISELDKRFQVEPVTPSHAARIISKREEILQKLSKNMESQTRPIENVTVELNKELEPLNDILRIYKGFYGNLLYNQRVVTSHEKRLVAMLFYLAGAARLDSGPSMDPKVELEILNTRLLVGELDKKIYDQKTKELQTLSKERQKLHLPTPKELENYLERSKQRFRQVAELHERGILTQKNYISLRDELTSDEKVLRDLVPLGDRAS